MTTMIETQKNLEEIFHKHQLMKTLKEQFSEVTTDPFSLEVVCQMYLHKQADVPTMVGLFSPKWGDPDDVAGMLLEVAQNDLIDYDQTTDRFVMKYGLSADVEEILAKYQFPLPMIVEPVKVTNNRMGSGYFDKHGSIVLNGSDIFDGEDVCLDHINRINSVALTLNMNVVASKEGNMIVPKRKVGEDFEEFQKRKKQAAMFYENSLDVMKGMMALGNTFYLTHKYDRRGRTYCVGYHINSQGTDYNKAVLELANKEMINQ